MSRLYRVVKLPSDEPVRYVGVYVLKWGKTTEPTVGFIPVDDPQEMSEEKDEQRH